jgi:gliding motility-associated-like protein
VKVVLICDNSQVFIPNTFTPNGDGYNDKFIISGKGLGLISHMTVFNRWGQIMYDAQNIPANDMSYGWDGTFKGEVLPPDVYMYVVEVSCETEGAVFKFHGDISLVR